MEAKNITGLKNVPESRLFIGHFKAFVNLLLLLYPILQIYGWGHITFALILTSSCGIIYLLVHGFKPPYPPYFLILYLLYWAIIHIVTASNLRAAMPLGVGRLLLITYLFYGCFDKRTALRLYRYIAAICIVFFYIQEISYALTGIRILGVIHQLPFAIPADLENYLDVAESMSRSSSFFSEPAHFAQFLLPLLAIELFNSQKTIHFFIDIILIATLLLLRSGNGMLGLIIITFIYSVYVINNKHTNIHHKAQILIFLILGIIGTLSYLQTEQGHVFIERFENISITPDKGTDMSAYMRIYRGYTVFADYSPTEKIFGTDNPQIIWSHAGKSFTRFEEKEDGGIYVNTIQNILLRTGFIGVILFGIMLIKMYKESNASGKTILLCFIGLMFVSSNHFSGTMFLYLLMSTPITSPNPNNQNAYLLKR